MMKFMYILQLFRNSIHEAIDDAVNQRDYVRPSNGPQQDHDALANDVRVFGNDITKAIARHGEQPYQRPGN